VITACFKTEEFHLNNSYFTTKLLLFVLWQCKYL